MACSGGADSVAMLGLLHLLAPGDGLTLSVGHVDHGLRPSSPQDAALVVDLAERLDLPVTVTPLSLPAGPGLPARARKARHAALAEQARAHGAKFVALGHTATDQAETMVLHLSRGAALLGLAAMTEHDPWPIEIASDGGLPVPGGILRPLLDLTRDQARQLAQRLSLPFVDDPTNADQAHPRALVRHQVLPALRRLNPRIEQALLRTAEHARDAEQALEQWADRECRARRLPLTTASPDDLMPSAHATPRLDTDPPVTLAARWSTQGLNQLPRAVRTRFVRRICRAAGSPEDALSARTMASIDDALLDPGPGRTWDLYPRRRLCIEKGELWVEDAEAATRAANH